MGEEKAKPRIGVPKLHIWNVEITKSTPESPEEKRDVEVTTGPSGPFSTDPDSSPFSPTPHHGERREAPREVDQKE